MVRLGRIAVYFFYCSRSKPYDIYTVNGLQRRLNLRRAAEEEYTTNIEGHSPFAIRFSGGHGHRSNGNSLSGKTGMQYRL